MAGFIARRALQTLGTLLLASLLFTAAMHLAPGDPARAVFGILRPTPEEYQAVVERYGFDRPFVVQYLLHLKRMLTLDMGLSTTGLPVVATVRAALPVSLKLVGLAALLQFVAGVLSAVVAAVTDRSFTRVSLRAAMLLLGSVPVIVLGVVVHGTIAWRYWMVPVVGTWDSFQTLILPAITLAGVGTAIIHRVTSSSLEQTLRSPFIQAARGRGVRERRVVGLHALKVAVPPLATTIAAEAGALLVGAILVERIFNVPGVGSVIVRAINLHDNTIVIGILEVVVVIVVLLNLVADLVTAWADPRIRMD